MESKKSVTRATVSRNIRIKAKNDISALNRDIDRIKQAISHTKSNLRIVIPILDVEKSKESINKARKVFASNEPFTSADFDQMVEDAGIREATEAEKEQIKQSLEEQKKQILSETLQHLKDQGEELAPEQTELFRQSAQQ